MKESTPTSSCNYLHPEYWMHEYEYLIGRLVDCLDACKDNGVLVDSLMSTNIIEMGTETHKLFCCGTRVLREFISDKFPLPDHHDSSIFNSKLLVTLTQACALEDQNLAYIFDLLKIAELLEGSAESLSPSMKAQVVCAMIGEMSLMVEAISDSDTNTSHSADSVMRFIKCTLDTLLDMIGETGRDRSSFMKQLRSPLPSAYPMPTFIRKENDTPCTCYTRSSMFSAPPQTVEGQSRLHDLLLTGSVSAIWLHLYHFTASTRV